MDYEDQRDRSEALYRGELTAAFERLSPGEQQALWERAGQDPDARQQLIVSVLPLVISAVRRGARRRGFRLNDVDVMDLIQDGNIRAIKALDTWDPYREGASTLAGWVYLHVEKPLWRSLRPIMDEQDSSSLTTDFALAGFDSSDESEWEPEPDVPEELRTPGDVVERSAEHQRLRQLVLALPEELRTVLVLTYWHGLTSREIAELTGIGHATVSRRLQTAHQLLGERLRETESGE